MPKTDRCHGIQMKYITVYLNFWAVTVDQLEIDSEPYNVQSVDNGMCRFNLKPGLRCSYSKGEIHKGFYSSVITDEAFSKISAWLSLVLVYRR